MNHLLPQVRDGFGKKDMNRGMGGQDPEGSFCSVFVLVLSYFRGICLVSFSLS